MKFLFNTTKYCLIIFCIISTSFSVFAIETAELEKPSSSKISLKKIFQDIKYDNIHPFYNGLALVEKDNKFGYINSDGDIVIPIKYVWATRFHNGRAFVVKENFWGHQKIALIDNMGKLLTEFKYDSAEFANRNAFELKATKDKRGKQFIFAMESSYLGYDASEFDPNELIMVSENNKYGFIDTSGKEVIPLIYDSASHFNERDFDNVSRVWVNGKAGLIDRKGNYILEHKYDYIQSFKNNIAYVDLKGRREIINLNKANEVKDLLLIKKVNNDTINTQLNANCTIDKHSTGWYYGLFNPSGKLAIDCVYHHIYFLTKDFINVELNDKEGVIDKKGKLIIPIEYEDLNLLGNKFFIVRETRSDGRFDEEYYGVFDTKGILLFPIEYEDISEIKINNHSLFILRKKDKEALVTPTGEVIIPFKPHSIEQIKENYFLLRGRDNNTFIKVMNNKPITTAIFDPISHYTSGATEFSVYDKNKTGVIDYTGKIIIPLTEKFAYIYEFKNGLAKVISPEGRYGIIDKKGKIVIPMNYENIELPQYGLIIVTNKEKSGILNQQGELIVPLKYDAIKIEKRYLLTFNQIGRKKEYSILKHNGEVIIKPTIDRLYTSVILGEPVFRIEKDGKWTLYDIDKNVIKQGILFE
ncbi:WG repeat-containing protein [Phocoenobacter skyensis]|uniref:WG containing repeat-containing protein n=1 Tax=Phocoenobacter skyensis TaxID=97481 RepID=A0A1H7Y632_9PAST|nr:WG repeat-containing protein [Pasteurella skyensis]MDP8079960.1 WG repeat-containing protein [Pasteurella skyensis]MDP8085856.1 WG repeat-containing protein [Pasteurella skyensis]MDP8185700.1 WG repeat-containing protein [Pasteurella skyensis]QLB22323.1 hypothetical protein A6B44_03545 [Pasteurella skyensis]SEM41334.1 WG containing repeat-containing protein [Pasteurella skyensis]